MSTLSMHGPTVATSKSDLVLVLALVVSSGEVSSALAIASLAKVVIGFVSDVVPFMMK